MGIQGLLPLLKSIMLPFHIKDLEGCSVAVDTYSWLHKGALSCSRELCKGLPTTRHIEYCMHRVNLLRHYGVKPILVFDGGLLPMKMEQENKRARARKENLARALECESNGNSSGAYEFYQKAVDISPSIAHELIQVLKQENVSYVVAPYEADAQMTFLAVSKQVDAIITEDSDLIPFGCPRIIFKMDKFGEGVEFQYSRLDRNKDLSFTGFSKQMLLEMCILSGCDYLQSLPGMGLKRAHALISKFKCYTKVIKHLRYSTISVPPQYEESFKKAVLTFQHQQVYDPITEEIIHLSDMSDDVGNDLDFLGPSISQHIATGIAKGDIDPITKLPFQEGSDGSLPVLERKFEVKSFKLGVERKKLELPVQKNVLTKYFCFASLEAKRKFMAPRISPKLPSLLDTSPPSPRDHVTIVDGTCEMNCSIESPPVYESVVDITHKNLEINDYAAEVPDLSHSPSDVDERSPEHNLLPIHKPCLALKKDRWSRNSADILEGKSRKENRKVIIRSHYFQHKQVNKIDKDNKQEKLVLKDDITIDQENKHEKLVLEGDFVTDISENAKPGSEFSQYSYLGGTTVKRKISTRDIIQNENVRPKQNCADETVHNKGYCDPTLEKNDREMKRAEGKFGSNISHIGRYSEIAEKSVERFVSVISKYRLSSSGSRASGLRAPLRDIRNTRTNRSSAAVDFSQFAYVPKKRKPA